MDRQEPTPVAYRRLSLGLLLLLYMVVAAFGGQRDFHYFECAAPIFYGGGDVYGDGPYLACVFPKGVPSSSASFAFPYPPQIFALLAPLFALPQRLQQPVFQAVSALAAAASFAVLTAVFRLNRSIRFCRAALLAAATLLPLLMALAMGQLSSLWLLVVACLIACARTPSRRGALVQGACLGVFVAKPQVVWLLALGWLAAAPFRRSLVAGASATALGLTAAAWVLHPASFGQFASKNFSGLLQFSTPTISSRLALVLPISAVILALVLGGLFLAASRTPRIRSLSPPGQASFLVAASLLTTPYLWSYDFALLLPLVFASLGCEESRMPLAMRLGLVLACNVGMGVQYSLAFQAGLVKPDGTDIWYPCVLLVVFVASVWSACARAGTASEPAA